MRLWLDPRRWRMLVVDREQAEEDEVGFAVAVFGNTNAADGSKSVSVMTSGSVLRLLVDALCM